MRILVLGASGMLGNAMMRVLSEVRQYEVLGTVRAAGSARFFSQEIARKLISGCDVENQDTLVKLFQQTKPDVVVNCIGVIKQLSDADDPLVAIPINALLPHRLAALCKLINARLVHVSTDCVFNGQQGGYTEDHPSDAFDLYGKSKYLGEIHETPAITLRTSIIGHELQSAHALIDWFLAQQDTCKGYRRAIFSGLPTVVLARLVRDVVLPRPELNGLYHVAAAPISKYALLQLVAQTYGKTIDIIPDDGLVIDRSLNADRFFRDTGYVAPAWERLIQEMYDFSRSE